MATREELEKRLKEREEAVAEQKARLPAHSIRPHQLLELERLEEERDEAAEALSRLEKRKG
ncbi:MAG: hypothetical protein JRI97_10150 [Deltaproteobacteria bacterium]|nr:hypothetical protein [Deltaproteobacteria bacterium]